MKKEVLGVFTELDGRKFYKIENYDCMEDFFMTITSSSDVWNFCWSKGGISAGRINSDNALFPYYTADKISDMKRTTGSRTVIALFTGNGTVFWEPFEPLLSHSSRPESSSIQRNIYKNENGTEIWFEEVNRTLGLSFRYGWTSSAKFGLVKLSCIENLDPAEKKLGILDGCINILPACVDAEFQKNNSILLDAYKQTDLDKKNGLVLFSVSSVVTDKAEPSEGLLANTCWFTADGGRIILGENAAEHFYAADGIPEQMEAPDSLKGERGAAFLARSLSLKKSSSWMQVFDTFLSAARIAGLQAEIADKRAACKKLEDDIASQDALMSRYISEADGIQRTAQEMTCTHHRANVLFNIMRGGFFADNGKINVSDFLQFVSERNKEKRGAAELALKELCAASSVEKSTAEALIEQSGDMQLRRLFMEYIPVIFSRRHGDPSRPWNKFNIRLNDKNGNPLLNYEGNWRDIFQNWEALLFSYPLYVKNICSKFLNAMTIDGFNPYRISREGIDWETPDPENPWAQYGYWGDHQIIYLQKLLEQWNSIGSQSLTESLNEKLYTSSNVPYRLKSYRDICRNPRSSILFDKTLSDSLIAQSKEFGSDRKLFCGKDGQPQLVSFTSKLMQIVISKAANLIPGGGIWMNTQRPEWNDANNALAGYGLSVVTSCYFYRMLHFLGQLYESSAEEEFSIPASQASCLRQLSQLYQADSFEKAAQDDSRRKAFADSAGLLFEQEREQLYRNGAGDECACVSRQEICAFISAVKKAVELTVRANRRSDGLYHSYNTMVISEAAMHVQNLQEMLEGQVAVLSSGLLSEQECIELLQSLKKSALFEPHQHSYLLYPNKHLPSFLEKNNVSAQDAEPLLQLISRTGTAFLEQDRNGTYHFNAQFKNARLMQDYADGLEKQMQPSKPEMDTLLALYEKTFRHQNFTGRSGTFYAYEGIGSIYWHMVSKLLLAVQENALSAYRKNSPLFTKLKEAYYDIQDGLSFKKTPQLYGAFPADPYSHTPFHRGAKQPGMTGQVKEEILARWGELGISVKDGKAQFCPVLLKKEEFFDGSGTLSFTWCGTAVEYRLAADSAVQLTFSGGKKQLFSGTEIPQKETAELFKRNGAVTLIEVSVPETSLS